ncbi:Acetylcholine receptor subunit alpha-type acr-16 [Aphelenchoides fujianensis]|nr:Acetylcholine receptor subunit alpha-type acr-16 [Aphelenchoides fujianensis]
MLIAVPLLFALFSARVRGSPAENRLMNDLLRGYVADERPLGVSLQQLIDLNERMEQLTVNMQVQGMWIGMNTECLGGNQPNTSEFCPRLFLIASCRNITDLRFPHKRVWVPDILLYNSVDSQFDTLYKVNLLVSHTGEIEWIPPSILTISCKLDIYFWPFGEPLKQWNALCNRTNKCASSSSAPGRFPGGQIDLVPGKFSTVEYMANGEWILRKTWTEKEEKFYGPTNEPFQSVRFFLMLRRRTLYYAWTLLFPVLLTMTLVLLGYTLSPFSCEKIGLQISVSLAICIFMSILASTTPQTSEAVPLLGLFLPNLHDHFGLLDGGDRLRSSDPLSRCHSGSKRMSFWASLKQRAVGEEDETKEEKDENAQFAEQIDHVVEEVGRTDRGAAARILKINEIYERVRSLRQCGRTDDDAGGTPKRRAGERPLPPAPPMALVVAASTTSIQLVVASYHERRLYEDLMRDYSTLERPVANHSQPVTVYLKVSLQQLIDVDEKNQVVTSWNDYKLRWDPQEYGNITDAKCGVRTFLLYNSVDSSFDSTFPTNLIVYSNGDISWVPPGIFKISCKIDIRWFPMDSQKCFFKFGSWTYAGSKLDLQPAKGGFDISEYMTNGEWALPMTTVSRSEKFYDCCPDEPYPDVTFYLHMKRRTLYYGGCLTSSHDLINRLPTAAGRGRERSRLQITVLLSICFFLSMLSDMSPPTSGGQQTGKRCRLLGIFFSTCLIIVTLSTCFTVYVLNLHYRTSETHSMSPTTRTILLYWLPYLLRIERPGVYLSWETNSIDIERQIQQYITGMSNGGTATAFKTIRNGGHSIDSTLVSVSPASDAGNQAILALLQKISYELKTITKRMQEEEREEATSNSWKFAAMVVDRLCLYVFTVFLGCTIVGILLAAPYLSD